MDWIGLLFTDHHLERSMQGRIGKGRACRPKCWPLVHLLASDQGKYMYRQKLKGTLLKYYREPRLAAGGGRRPLRKPTQGPPR